MPTDVKAYRRWEDAIDRLEPRLELVAFRCIPLFELFDMLLYWLLSDELLSL